MKLFTYYIHTNIIKILGINIKTRFELISLVFLKISSCAITAYRSWEPLAFNQERVQDVSTVIQSIIGAVASAVPKNQSLLSVIISTVFLLFFSYYLNKKKKQTKEMGTVWGILLSNVFTICFVFINLLCIIEAKRRHLVLLDYMFTGRLSMAARYFNGVCGGKLPLFPMILQSYFW